jgi:outer membrane protein assembly factor BamD
MHRFPWKIAVVGLVCTVGCRPEFQLKKFTTNEALYAASMRQFERGKWDDAAAGFEKLTMDLAPLDTQSPLSFWYLGLSRQHQHDYQLAAQSFTRLFESYPDDSLAPHAIFQEAKSYQSMWTRPDRDASWGDAALTTYSSLSTYYPQSPLNADAAREIAALQEMFAQKNFETGMYYFRDKLYDSANIYFKRVMELWPNAPTAKDAALHLVESYRKLKYAEEASEMCATLRSRYPSDGDVAESCPPDSSSGGGPPVSGDPRSR